MEDLDSTVDPKQNKLPRWDEDNGQPVWGPKTFELARQCLYGFQNIRQEDREDIIQEFAVKHILMEGFEGRGNFSAWLGSCLEKAAIDFLRVKTQSRIDPDKRRKWVGLEIEDEEGERQELPLPGKIGPCDHVGLAAHYIRTRLGKKNETSDLVQKHLAECRACEQLFERFGTEEGKVHEFLASVYFHWGWLENEAYLDNAIVTFIEEDTYRESRKRAIVRQLESDREEKKRQLKELRDKPAFKTESQDEAKDNEVQKQELIRQLEAGLEKKNRQLEALTGEPAINTKGQRTCSKCGQSGHNARTCSPSKEDTQSHPSSAT